MSKRTSLSVSARRHFIDKFFLSHTSLLAEGARVIDIGGKKAKKRGLFDIGKLNLSVTYVNIDKEVEPDIVADATKIPLPDQSFDVAIIAELLEHVRDPKAVLQESFRLLKHGGVALVTVPFNVGVHGDPHDFGRYTASFLELASREAGFQKIEIEEQGTLFAVATLMLQHLFRAKGVSWSPIQDSLVKFLMWLDGKTTNPLLKSWTTGYGIILTK